MSIYKDIRSFTTRSAEIVSFQEYIDTYERSSDIDGSGVDIYCIDDAFDIMHCELRDNVQLVDWGYLVDHPDCTYEEWRAHDVTFEEINNTVARYFQEILDKWHEEDGIRAWSSSGEDENSTPEWSASRLSNYRFTRVYREKLIRDGLTLRLGHYLRVSNSNHGIGCASNIVGKIAGMAHGAKLFMWSQTASGVFNHYKSHTRMDMGALLAQCKVRSGIFRPTVMSMSMGSQNDPDQPHKSNQIKNQNATPLVNGTVTESISYPGVFGETSDVNIPDDVARFCKMLKLNPDMSFNSIRPYNNDEGIPTTLEYPYDLDFRPEVMYEENKFIDNMEKQWNLVAWDLYHDAMDTLDPRNMDMIAARYCVLAQEKTEDDQLFGPIYDEFYKNHGHTFRSAGNQFFATSTVAEMNEKKKYIDDNFLGGSITTAVYDSASLITSDISDYSEPIITVNDTVKGIACNVNLTDLEELKFNPNELADRGIVEGKGSAYNHQDLELTWPKTFRIQPIWSNLTQDQLWSDGVTSFDSIAGNTSYNTEFTGSTAYRMLLYPSTITDLPDTRYIVLSGSIEPTTASLYTEWPYDTPNTTDIHYSNLMPLYSTSSFTIEELFQYNKDNNPDWAAAATTLGVPLDTLDEVLIHIVRDIDGNFYLPRSNYYHGSMGRKFKSGEGLEIQLNETPIPSITMQFPDAPTGPTTQSILFLEGDGSMHSSFISTFINTSLPPFNNLTWREVIYNHVYSVPHDFEINIPISPQQDESGNVLPGSAFTLPMNMDTADFLSIGGVTAEQANFIRRKGDSAITTGDYIIIFPNVGIVGDTLHKDVVYEIYSNVAFNIRFGPWAKLSPGLDGDANIKDDKDNKYSPAPSNILNKVSSIGLISTDLENITNHPAFPNDAVIITGSYSDNTLPRFLGMSAIDINDPTTHEGVEVELEDQPSGDDGEDRINNSLELISYHYKDAYNVITPYPYTSQRASIETTHVDIDSIFDFLKALDTIPTKKDLYIQSIDGTDTVKNTFMSSIAEPYNFVGCMIHAYDDDDNIINNEPLIAVYDYDTDVIAGIKPPLTKGEAFQGITFQLKNPIDNLKPFWSNPFADTTLASPRTLLMYGINSKYKYNMLYFQGSINVDNNVIPSIDKISFQVPVTSSDGEQYSMTCVFGEDAINENGDNLHYLLNLPYYKDNLKFERFYEPISDVDITGLTPYRGRHSLLVLKENTPGDRRPRIDKKPYSPIKLSGWPNVLDCNPKGNVVGGTTLWNQYDIHKANFEGTASFPGNYWTSSVDITGSKAYSVSESSNDLGIRDTLTEFATRGSRVTTNAPARSVLVADTSNHLDNPGSTQLDYYNTGSDYYRYPFFLASCSFDNMKTTSGQQLDGLGFMTSSEMLISGKPCREAIDFSKLRDSRYGYKMAYYDNTGRINIFKYNSGTSFSCPLSAGTAALWLDLYPHLTQEELTNLLEITAYKDQIFDANLFNPDVSDLQTINDFEKYLYGITKNFQLKTSTSANNIQPPYVSTHTRDRMHNAHEVGYIKNILEGTDYLRADEYKTGIETRFRRYIYGYTQNVYNRSLVLGQPNSIIHWPYSKTNRADISGSLHDIIVAGKVNILADALKDNKTNFDPNNRPLDDDITLY